MSLRHAPLSNTERQSVIASLAAGVRLDGRSLLENREVSVQFGQSYGCCTVSLGETRVLAQVSCEVVEPRPSRPNEGKIVTSVHITPMAGPEYEAGRTSDAQDELQQLLESNVRESRCLDLESLCIMAEDSVWQLRADVTVLNACGNLGDACNMAVVAALKHFHRPDVTVQEDGRVTVHSFAEREPIPTFLKKVPVCLTYAFCEQPDSDLIVFSDPTELEERVVRGRLVVGLNPHGEITSMNFPGLVMLEKKHISFCINNAFQRAKEVAQLVEKLVEEDLVRRKQEVHPRGFVNKLVSDEQHKKDRIESKVAMMTMMTSQLRRVREMVDRDEIKQEPPEGMDDGADEDSDDSSTSSDSEFSDTEKTLEQPSTKTKDLGITPALNEKSNSTNKKHKEQIANKENRKDDDDSEEEILLNIKVE